VIFDEFKGQTTGNVLSCLNENNTLYVMVSPNCMGQLQPLDVSVNKPAKDFLRAKFRDWYAKKIFTQLVEREGSTGNSTINPVDLRLSVIKPIGAQWMIELYYYFKDHPQIIINGFKEVRRYLMKS